MKERAIAWFACASTIAALLCAGSAASQRPTANVPICDGETVASVIGCAGRYVVALEGDLASVVASEEYVQSSSVGGLDQSVTLHSDVLIVRNPAGPGWVPFRDVFDVNGKSIRNHDQRLERLFQSATGTAFEEARRIMDEGARFNLGPARNVNVPTLALIFFEPSNVSRSRFRKTGEKGIEKTLCWVIDFEEIGSPTVIRSPGNTDVPALGTVWIDPNTGRILQTFLKIPYGGVLEELTVTFRNDARLNVFVPHEMTEMLFEGTRRVLKGRAAYSDFKRFDVNTSQTIKR